MNAITKMLNVLDFIRGEEAAEFAELSDPVLGAPTISIGTIRGGSKTNIVPDACEATVDFRVIPAQYTPTLADTLAARFRGVCPDVEVNVPLAPGKTWSDVGPETGSSAYCRTGSTGTMAPARA